MHYRYKFYQIHEIFIISNIFHQILKCSHHFAVGAGKGLVLHMGLEMDLQGGLGSAEGINIKQRNYLLQLNKIKYTTKRNGNKIKEHEK